MSLYGLRSSVRAYQFARCCCKCKWRQECRRVRREGWRKSTTAVQKRHEHINLSKRSLWVPGGIHRHCQPLFGPESVHSSSQLSLPISREQWQNYVAFTVFNLPVQGGAVQLTQMTGNTVAERIEKPKGMDVTGTTKKTWMSYQILLIVTFRWSKKKKALTDCFLTFSIWLKS